MKTLSRINALIGIFLFIIAIHPQKTLAVEDEVKSEFERYFKDRKGNIPKDYIQLIQDLTKYFKTDSPAFINLIQIPDSRSPERKASSFTHPRLLTKVRSTEDYLPETFLGFNETLKQVQIISWNRIKREYEFMEVDSFGDDKPSLRIQPSGEKNSCLVCHQDGGPLLSRFPWSEFGRNAQNLNTSIISEKIEKSRKEAGLKPILVNNRNAREDNPGVFDDSPFSYDSSVRAGGHNIALMNICKNLCEDNLDCRKELLFASLLFGKQKTLNPNTFVQTSSQEKRLLEPFAAILNKALSEEKFLTTSSVLPDRDPLRLSEKGGVVTYPETNEPEKSKALKTAFFDPTKSTSPLDIIPLISESAISEGIGFEGSLADPQKIRPKVSFWPSNTRDQIGKDLPFNFTVNLALCLGFTLKEASKLKFLQAATLRKFVDSDEAKLVLNQWPPEPSKILNAIKASGISLDSVKLKPTPVDVCTTTSDGGNIPLNIEKAIPNSDKIQDALQIKKSEVLGVLNRSCGQCHSGETASIQLPLDNIEKLSNYNKGVVLSRIDLNSKQPMPPEGATNPLSTEERELLIQVLKNPELIKE